MSKNKSKKNSTYTIGFIIIILLLVGIYYSVYSKDSSNDPINKVEDKKITTSEEISQNDNNNEDNQISYNGTLYYTKNSDNVVEIFSKKDNEEEKLIYTDSDEDNKIKFTHSMTNSAKILALIAPKNQDFGGSLYLINSDGSGEKEQIIEQFTSPQPPAISSDESNIAYVLFSNAEMEYGFSLYIMNLNGENKVKIDNDETMISNPTFDQNVKNIAYLKNNKLVYSDLDGAQKKEIYSLKSNEQLESMNWDNENSILISVYDGTKSKIISINPETNDNDILYEASYIITNPTYVDSDYTSLAFINSDTGKIEIMNVDGNISNITEATSIIKWLK